MFRRYRFWICWSSFYDLVSLLLHLDLDLHHFLLPLYLTWTPLSSMTITNNCNGNSLSTLTNWVCHYTIPKVSQHWPKYNGKSLRTQRKLWFRAVATLGKLRVGEGDTTERRMVVRGHAPPRNFKNWFVWKRIYWVLRSFCWTWRIFFHIDYIICSLTTSYNWSVK